MMMKLTLFSVAALLGHSISAADEPSPTVPVWIPGYGGEANLTVEGSIIGVKDSKTTLHFCIDYMENTQKQCATELYYGQSITMASDMYELSQSVESYLTQVISCSLDGTKSAECTMTGGMQESGTTASLSMTEVFSGSDFMFHPVTITAGAEKLGDDVPTKTGEGISAASTGADSSDSTGGMPAITAAPRWAVVGGGAIVGAVLAI